jgi:hypothetical protein
VDIKQLARKVLNENIDPRELDPCEAAATLARHILNQPPESQRVAELEAELRGMKLVLFAIPQPPFMPLLRKGTTSDPLPPRPVTICQAADGLQHE